MRSSRKKKKSPVDIAKEYIYQGTDPDGYREELIPLKGRGIVTDTERRKGDFLLVYNGDLITGEEGEDREDENESTFRYFFSFKGKKWCVDATREPSLESSGRFGRLVNHGRRDKNCVMKVIECNGLPSLCLFALKDILPNEELLYDYGVSNLPWENKSERCKQGKKLREKKSFAVSEICDEEPSVANIHVHTSDYNTKMEEPTCISSSGLSTAVSKICDVEPSVATIHVLDSDTRKEEPTCTFSAGLSTEVSEMCDEDISVANIDVLDSDTRKEEPTYVLSTGLSTAVSEMIAKEPPVANIYGSDSNTGMEEPTCTFSTKCTSAVSEMSAIEPPVACIHGSDSNTVMEEPTCTFSTGLSTEVSELCAKEPPVASIHWSDSNTRMEEPTCTFSTGLSTEVSEMCDEEPSVANIHVLDSDTRKEEPTCTFSAGLSTEVSEMCDEDISVANIDVLDSDTRKEEPTYVLSTGLSTAVSEMIAKEPPVANIYGSDSNTGMEEPTCTFSTKCTSAVSEMSAIEPPVACIHGSDSNTVMEEPTCTFSTRLSTEVSELCAKEPPVASIHWSDSNTRMEEPTCTFSTGLSTEVSEMCDEEPSVANIHVLDSDTRKEEPTCTFSAGLSTEVSEMCDEDISVANIDVLDSDTRKEEPTYVLSTGLSTAVSEMIAKEPPVANIYGSDSNTGMEEPTCTFSTKCTSAVSEMSAIEPPVACIHGSDSNTVMEEPTCTFSTRLSTEVSELCAKEPPVASIHWSDSNTRMEEPTCTFSTGLSSEVSEMCDEESSVANIHVLDSDTRKEEPTCTFPAGLSTAVSEMCDEDISVAKIDVLDSDTRKEEPTYVLSTGLSTAVSEMCDEESSDTLIYGSNSNTRMQEPTCTFSTKCTSAVSEMSAIEPPVASIHGSDSNTRMEEPTCTFSTRLSTEVSEMCDEESSDALIYGSNSNTRMEEPTCIFSTGLSTEVSEMCDEESSVANIHVLDSDTRKEEPTCTFSAGLSTAVTELCDEGLSAANMHSPDSYTAMKEPTCIFSTEQVLSTTDAEIGEKSERFSGRLLSGLQKVSGPMCTRQSGQFAMETSTCQPDIPWQTTKPRINPVLKSAADSTLYISGSDSDCSEIFPMLNIDKVTEEEKISSTVQEVGLNRKGKHDYQKLHACLYCGKMDLKISRHLLTHHQDEPDVAKLPTVSKNRNSTSQRCREKELDSLRNMGDFLYNVEQLQKKKVLPLIVARRPAGGKHTLSDYLPCKFCLRFYLKGELWRHCKTCLFMGEPLSNFYKDMDDIKGVKQFRKAGQLLLEGAVGPKSLSEKEKRDFYHFIANALTEDEVGKEVLKDNSLLELGNNLFEKLGKQRASEVRYRLRLLARLKAKLKDRNVSHGPDMSSYIRPENYDMFLECTKELVGVCEERSLNGVKMFKKPEMAKKIGHLIRRMANFKIGKAIKEKDTVARQEATDFIALHEVEWTEKISSIAHQTTKEKRFNKKDMLPVTEDLISLQKFLDTKLREYTILLNTEKTMSNWRNFAKILLCKVQSFNFRRGNEASKMLLAKFLERANWRQCNSEIVNTLQTLEQEIAKRMDLVEVIGKQNRKVPILLTPSIRKGIDLLVATREEVGIYSNNPYVFAKGEESYIRGADALNYVLDKVDLKHPQYIKFPKMRKYLATVVQVFGLKEVELNEVARHMGHELSVHREYYRLQDDVIELAKVSKLLLAVEKGVAHKFAGLSLDDIEIDALPGVQDEEVIAGVDDDGDVENDEISAAEPLGLLASNQANLSCPTPQSCPDEERDNDELKLNKDSNPVQAKLPDLTRKRRRTSKASVKDRSYKNTKHFEFESDDHDDVRDPDFKPSEKDQRIYSESDSDSDMDVPVQRKKQKGSKKKWTEDEKEILKPLVLESFRKKKPPVRGDIEKLKLNTNYFKDLKWTQIKHQVWAMAQQKVKKCSNILQP